MSDPLAEFSIPVRAWFGETFGEPTPPQAEGWPPIQRGEHTLILAPTGSGKTLAAFLWGIDELYRELMPRETHQDSSLSRPDHEGLRAEPPRMTSPRLPEGTSERRAVAAGVRLLYISPLKALNNDIERNLRAPLAGIRAVAARVGQPLPALRVAVRTGDTPAPVRAQMLKNPPHILITTPESLYLLLTSPRARDMFRGTRTVIVDEIHTLCGDKRGAHLAISLERLERLAGVRVQRIGLSATIRPLAEVARFLGGQEPEDGRLGPGRLVDGSLDPQSADLPSNQSTNIPTYHPRPVTIIDTGYHKPLDLQVITPVDDFHDLPGNSIWPAVIPRVLGDVMRHRSTLIFCNNRRLAERTADRLNAQIAAEQSEEVPPGSTEVLAPGGVMRDRGMFAIGAEGPIRAHHASMSREARQRMEEDLKAGRLPALVGTSSLELGIDIGAVDLVVQLQSPKSVAQGLQRVGRSGHLVGQTSRGRIYATFREDLVEAAAVARGMLEGDVEPTFAPQNPLDVLAQQVVAMVSVEDWPAPALYDLVRQAYPYRELPEDSFRSGP
jgi:ATP-dependent Lhr-like helicase